MASSRRRSAWMLVFSIAQLFDGAIVGALENEFGWSRTDAMLGVSIMFFIVAALNLPMGVLIDRIGPRRIGICGMILVFLSYAALGTATGTVENWLALWGVLSIGIVMVQTPVWTSAVATRFETSRGLAFAVTLSGTSISAALLPMIATSMIDWLEWRHAYLATGAIWLAIALPLVLFGFRGKTDRKTGLSDDDRLQLPIPGLALSEGFRSPIFYKLLLAGGLFALVVIGLLVHFIPILRGRGVPAVSAAGIAALSGIFSILGRLGTGLLLDRFDARIVGVSIFMLGNVGCVLLLFGSNYFLAAVAAAIVGITLGAETDVIAFLASRHFGLRNFGSLFGGLVASLALGAGLGPLLAGAIYDGSGNYQLFLGTGLVLMTVSAVALGTLPRPRFQRIECWPSATTADSCSPFKHPEASRVFRRQFQLSHATISRFSLAA